MFVRFLRLTVVVAIVAVILSGLALAMLPAYTQSLQEEANAADLATYITTAKNHPPRVKFASPFHDSYVGGVVDFCGWATDADGDRLSANWTASRGGKFIKRWARPQQRPSLFCTRYRMPRMPGWLIIRMIVDDGRVRQSVVKSTGLCVLPQDFGDGTDPRPADCP